MKAPLSPSAPSSPPTNGPSPLSSSHRQQQLNPYFVPTSAPSAPTSSDTSRSNRHTETATGFNGGNLSPEDEAYGASLCDRFIGSYSLQVQDAQPHEQPLNKLGEPGEPLLRGSSLAPAYRHPFGMADPTEGSYSNIFSPPPPATAFKTRPSCPRPARPPLSMKMPPPPFQHQHQHQRETMLNPPAATRAAISEPGPASCVDQFGHADTQMTTTTDANYPTPSLYNITLKLNTDPGLDAWWSNVTNVLQHHYGAERVTLAVPRDSTDLETVPWGLKATSSAPTAAQQASFAAQDAEADIAGQKPKKSHGASDSPASGLTNSKAKRPKLMDRHSFTGYERDLSDLVLRGLESSLRHDRFHRRRNSAEAIEKRHKALRSSKAAVDTVSRSMSPAQCHAAQTQADNETMAASTPSSVVFQFPQALESEPQPLLKAADIVNLFGKSNPVILTREYAQDPMVTPQRPQATFSLSFTTAPTDTTEIIRGLGHLRTFSVPQQPTSCPTGDLVPDDHRASHRASVPEGYEDHEQAQPSPWSQSPAPSPAAQQDPDLNPFFSGFEPNEDAFASSPPLHDYSGNKSVEAIGVDRSMTIVHLPVLHSPASKPPSPNTLRFPVAIISFAASVVPYPANWRSSLSYLLPHLATSYCLAMQYTELEQRLANSAPRHGRILGLGGTFSDASSELELVAGLRGHFQQPLTEYNVMNELSALSSPGTTSSIARSPSVLSLTGLSRPEGSSNTGSRPRLTSRGKGDYSARCLGGSQSSDRQRGGRSSVPSEFSISYPTSPRADPAGEETAVDDLTPMESDTRQLISPRPQSPEIPSTAMTTSSQRSLGSRLSSSTSIATQLNYDAPTSRPFSDSIAQLMLNSVPLHLFLAKPHTGEVIWTNSKYDAYRRRSHAPESRVKDPWQDVHESERGQLQAEWAKTLQTGSQLTQKVRVKQVNDESAYRWFIFRANPLLSGTGEVLYWIGSFLDIHDQHVAELEAAKEKRALLTDAKYKALANSIPQVVFEASEYHGLISANEQWQLFTGQSLEDAANFGFAKNIHRDDLEKCGILSPPRLIPDSVDVPEFSHIVTNSTEVPEVPPTPAKTQRSDSSSSDKSHAGPFAYGVSQALTELVKRGVVTIQRDENGRDSYTTELRFRSRRGEFRWHLVRLVKVENPLGKGEASWYGTCTDINDRKILERELNSAMQKLNKEMESKTNFFRNMSHEIRTPLNGILGTIPFILETPLDNDQRRMLDTIQNSSTNLRELVDNILDVSRMEAGKMNIIPQWFHIPSMLEDVMDTTASRAIDKGLELNYLVDIDVPSMVMGDRFRIRQILINLVGNAVKFTAHGEIYTRCSILKDPSIPHGPSEILLNFEVVDTGKGFSSTDAQRLMQRFSQIETCGTQQQAGSGLGLFLSKQLVEMHGGRLTPSSTEGRGAKFSFYVKVGNAEPQPQTKASKRKSSPGGGSRPILKPGQPIVPVKALLKQDLVESPTQDSSVASSSCAPGNSSRSESSATSMSSVTPDVMTSSPSSNADPIDQNALHLELPPSLFQQSARKMATPGQPDGYSVVIVCPLEYAREAIQQHIERVVPLGVPTNVKALSDVSDWKELASQPLTHVVLCWPNSSQVPDIAQNFVGPDAPPDAANLVVVLDMALKRDLCFRFGDLVTSPNGKISLVHKPVKPSAFAKIFDPTYERDLSKDRNQDEAREHNNSFKTMSKLVKEVIGNKGYRVLLVEDDETNRTVMLKYLEKVKLASEVAANGQQCIDMVFSKEPGYYSLIICDIQMPLKNGYETCREIRAWEQRNHFPEIPIMALSASAMVDQIDEASRAGFNDYVTKPIKHNELGKMIMELLDPSSPRVLLRDRIHNV